MRLFAVSFFLICINYINFINCDVKISTHDIELKKGDEVNVYLIVNDYDTKKEILFNITHPDLIDIAPNPVKISNKNDNITLVVKAKNAGHSEIYPSDDTRKDLQDAFLRVTVNKVPFLDTFSTIIGWIYFVAWSISFYPQIYENFKRKSVVGLNFDFLALNLIGFTLYSIFNIGLYSIDEMKEEYFNRHPRGLNPVKLNDIFFAVHAVIATIVTIVQCFIFQRDEQRVSMTARGIITVFALFLLGSTILVFTGIIHWLDFLYYCSYVKLTITLIKYVPQAYMNYKRKSTVGWSIGNIFLDFTGGILSMLQMILDSYNYDDWISIFGDPTKFGLGLFSVIFDIFFVTQHYILYRHSQYEENP